MFTWLMFTSFPCFLLIQSHGQEKSSSYYDLFNFRVYNSTDMLSSISTSPSSSILPPQYSPSKSNKAGPICRRTWLGPVIWRRGRSSEYGGGLFSDQTKHCHGLMGPSIKDLSTAGVIILLGTLTILGKVWPPIVVRTVVPTQSWVNNTLELGPLQLSSNPWSILLNYPPSPASLTSLSICSTNPTSLRAGASGPILPNGDAPTSPLSSPPSWSSPSLPPASDCHRF